MKILALFSVLLFSFPSFARAQEEFTLPNSFKLIQRLGEVANLKVVIIGDAHAVADTSISEEMDHFRRGLPIILGYGQPGDLILLEGEDWLMKKMSVREYDRFKSDHPLRRLDRRFQVGGWDRFDLVTASNIYHEEFIRNGASPEWADQVKSNFYQRLLYEVGVRDRNRVMLHAIENALQEGYERVFIFTGTRHALDQELLRYLNYQKISHVVMAANVSETIAEVKTGLDQMKAVFREASKHKLQSLRAIEESFIDNQRMALYGESDPNFARVTLPRFGEHPRCNWIFSL